MLGYFPAININFSVSIAYVLTDVTSYAVVRTYNLRRFLAYLIKLTHRGSDLAEHSKYKPENRYTDINKTLYLSPVARNLIIPIVSGF